MIIIQTRKMIIKLGYVVFTVHDKSLAPCKENISPWVLLTDDWKCHIITTVMTCWEEKITARSESNAYTEKSNFVSDVFFFTAIKFNIGPRSQNGKKRKAEH